jgi:hypothetical protein
MWRMFFKAVIVSWFVGFICGIAVVVVLWSGSRGASQSSASESPAVSQTTGSVTSSDTGP